MGELEIMWNREGPDKAAVRDCRESVAIGEGLGRGGRRKRHSMLRCIE